MFAALLALVQSYSYNVSSKGFTSNSLGYNDILFVNVPSGYQAFVLCSSSLYYSSTITIYSGYSYKTYSPAYNMRAFASTASTIKVTFSSSSYTTVNVWIIPDSMCSQHALYVQNSNKIEATVSTSQSYAKSCIFSGYSSIYSSLTYGHSSSSYGNAYVIDENYFNYYYPTIYSCTYGGKCSYSGNNAYFVVYNNSLSSLYFKKTNNYYDSTFYDCESGYIYYITMSGMSTDPFYSSSDISSSCSSSDDIWTEYYTLWITLIVIMVILVCLLPICCCCCAGAAACAQNNGTPQPLIQDENVPQIAPVVYGNQPQYYAPQYSPYTFNQPNPYNYGPNSDMVPQVHHHNQI